MNNIEISFLDVDMKENMLETWSRGIKEYCRDVLKKLKINNWEVSILVCSDKLIQELNNKYGHSNRPTDVLSFEQGGMAGDKIIAGDIVISHEYVKNNAVKNSIDFNDEFKRVLVHGMLHLNGMKHDTPESKMPELEEKILKSLPKEPLL